MLSFLPSHHLTTPFLILSYSLLPATPPLLFFLNSPRRIPLTHSVHVSAPLRPSVAHICKSRLLRLKFINAQTCQVEQTNKPRAVSSLPCQHALVAANTTVVIVVAVFVANESTASCCGQKKLQPFSLARFCARDCQLCSASSAVGVPLHKVQSVRCKTAAACPPFFRF